MSHDKKDLDDLNILYSGSKSEAFRKTWNKGLTKKILKENNINTPSFIELEKFDPEIVTSKLNDASFDFFQSILKLFWKVMTG